jgi:glycosyltransferase involved in cell wall biosynthesis
VSHTVPAATRIPVLLLVHSLGHGGTERQVAVLARHLDRERFEVHVASVLEGFRAEELRSEGIALLPIPIRSFFDPGPWKLSGFLADYIREHRIRLLHVFDPGLSMVATMAAKRCSGVRLLSSQRCYMDLVPVKYRYPLLASHWLSDGVVANSDALKEHLRRTYLYPGRRIDVCHNGVDTDAFSPNGRARLPQLSGSGLVIGSVCVMRREKNLPQLIQAFAQVRKRSEAKLLLMGSGPEEASLRSLVAELNLTGDCCFLPSSPDVRGALRSIDIFVSPSLSEGLPNAVMEAMACGCAVVSSNVGGCPELIDHGIHGLLAKPADLEDMIRQLETLVQDRALCAQVGSAGAARMQRDFSIPASTRRMQSIYARYLAFQL